MVMIKKNASVAILPIQKRIKDCSSETLNYSLNLKTLSSKNEKLNGSTSFKLTS